MKEENREEQMKKRRETMPDGKRYIVFYTFGDETATVDKQTQESQESKEQESV